MLGSRLEYDSLPTNGNSNKNEMSVDIKTINADGIIFFTRQPVGNDVMAIYLMEGKVI